MASSLSTAAPQISIVGGLPPPDGVVPNFVNPDSIGPALKALLGFFVVLSTIDTFIRLYASFRIIKAHGWEDCE
jgi:hypothetical protein